MDTRPYWTVEHYRVWSAWQQATRRLWVLKHLMQRGTELSPVCDYLPTLTHLTPAGTPGAAA
ncbi:MAG: hypothetical protein ACRERD_20800 [Candidatus Binatia bacterium]